MGISLKRRISFLCSLLAPLVAGSAGFAQTALYQSRQITPAREYTFNIEGPAVDAAGNLYVVNFQRPGTIGKWTPGSAQSTLFVSLPAGSVGNSIRFDAGGRMFIADYKLHNVFVIDGPNAAPREYFHSDEFNQPNDMTVAGDGTIFASDPNWKKKEGQIWRIARAADGSVSGRKMVAPRAMSTTNGIDLSPDGRTLFVGESDTREIWAYRVEGDSLAAPRLVRKFDDFSIDGLRSDIDGRLYVTRILKGTVAVMTADGKIEREITLTAKEPTNVAFGGPDGRTVYVTQRQGGYIESFLASRPGREFCLQPGRCSGVSIR